MDWKVLTIIYLALLALSTNGQSLTNQTSSCKDPTVVHRRLSDDVRYASPFYVIGLPRNNKTEVIDNVCYTYFETGNGHFFHVISVVYNNGSNSYYTFSKGDISNRLGLAEATAEKTSPCIYHDYTLTPICNVSVFMLYRCFITGDCDDIDIGIIPGVDVRVVLAATPHISAECRSETETSLKDTSSLAGGDYVILPQVRKPQCVTNYLGTPCINAKKALGSIVISAEDAALRFGENSEDLVFSGTTTTPSPTKKPMTEPLNPKAENNGGIEFTGTTLPSKPITPEKENTTSASVTTPSSTTPASNSQSSFPTSPPRRTYADVVKSKKNPQIKGVVKA